MKKVAAVKQQKTAAGVDPKQKKKKPVDDTKVEIEDTPEDDPSHNESGKEESEVSRIGLINMPFSCV